MSTQSSIYESTASRATTSATSTVVDALGPAAVHVASSNAKASIRCLASADGVNFIPLRTTTAAGEGYSIAERWRSLQWITSSASGVSTAIFVTWNTD